MIRLIQVNQMRVEKLKTLFEENVDRFVDSNFSLAPKICGHVVRVVGLTLEAKGIVAPLGAHCKVASFDNDKTINAEVVGFQNEILYLIPFDEPIGISPGAKAVSYTHLTLPTKRIV